MSGFPIGRKRAAPEAIVGAKGEGFNGAVRCAFDSGYGGNAFEFRVTDGTIQFVQLVGID